MEYLVKRQTTEKKNLILKLFFTLTRKNKCNNKKYYLSLWCKFIAGSESRGGGL